MNILCWFTDDHTFVCVKDCLIFFCLCADDQLLSVCKWPKELKKMEGSSPILKCSLKIFRKVRKTREIIKATKHLTFLCFFPLDSLIFKLYSNLFASHAKFSPATACSTMRLWVLPHYAWKWSMKYVNYDISQNDVNFWLKFIPDFQSVPQSWIANIAAFLNSDSHMIVKFDYVWMRYRFLSLWHGDMTIFCKVQSFPIGKETTRGSHVYLLVCTTFMNWCCVRGLRFRHPSQTTLQRFRQPLCVPRVACCRWMYLE